jgi:hypothetical protein
MTVSNTIVFTVSPRYFSLTVDSKAIENGRVYPITVSVFIDDVYAGNTPLMEKIAEGKHKLYVSAEPPYSFKYWGDGVTDNPRTINITSDITLTAYFKYIAEGLAVDARDNLGLRVPAEIYVDGKYVGDAPVTVEIKGLHTLEARCKMPWLYQWYRWSDGVTANPRSIDVVGYVYIVAEYIYIGGVY